jgi:hypothetical protein
VSELQVGMKVIDSPVGPGEITDVTGAGFPEVNDVAVAWAFLEEGVFDPRRIAPKEKEKVFWDIVEGWKSEDRSLIGDEYIKSLQKISSK